MKNLCILFVFILPLTVPEGMETSAQEKHRPRQSYFIPDVCRDLGIPCVTLLGMMRRERWVF